MKGVILYQSKEIRLVLLFWRNSFSIHRWVKCEKPSSLKGFAVFDNTHGEIFVFFCDDSQIAAHFCSWIENSVSVASWEKHSLSSTMIIYVPGSSEPALPDPIIHCVQWLLSHPLGYIFHISPIVFEMWWLQMLFLLYFPFLDYVLFFLSMSLYLCLHCI